MYRSTWHYTTRLVCMSLSRGIYGLGGAAWDDWVCCSVDTSWSGGVPHSQRLRTHGGVGSLGGLSPVARTRALDTMASAVGEETWLSSRTPSKSEATWKCPNVFKTPIAPSKSQILTTHREILIRIKNMLILGVRWFQNVQTYSKPQLHLQSPKF
jgi:hypothetical protein